MTPFRTSRIRSAFAFALALSIGSSPVWAQPAPLTLRYTTGAPAKTPWVMQLERFAKDVEEESKGSIKIDQFIAAQLGNEQDTAQQIARGRIDMGGFSSGSVALLVPEIALFGLPFYFKSIAEQDCVLDTVMTKPVTELLAKKGVSMGNTLSDGTSAFMNTNYAQVSEDTNNQHICIYSRTNTDGAVADMGVVSGLLETNIISRFANQFYFRMQGANITTVASPNSLGLFMANRTISTIVKGIKNSTINSVSNTSTGIITSFNIFIGAYNLNGSAFGFSSRQLAFSSIGFGLTDAQVSTFYTAVQAFQTTLSRQV
jgi:hypothetical protein